MPLRHCIACKQKTRWSVIERNAEQVMNGQPVQVRRYFYQCSQCKRMLRT